VGRLEAPIRRVLIANRGEIAVRIVHACRESGIEAVAVYSDADEHALHTRCADRAVRIGPAAAAESYLSIPTLIAAAQQTESDAIHPGYGFLSERPEFARACEQAGITFIGPPSAVIERMGSKIAARELMVSAGVPVVPGQTPADQSDSGVAAAARAIGYPVLVKASAGGGGKGMRVVHGEREANAAIQAARREALAAFGDGTLYIEKLLQHPRHVEIQVFGDARGNIVHLFERECSLQRRHQKVIEESPSPAITPGIRARIGAAAVAAARAAGYRSAGTVEFLVEGVGDAVRFYFLEMNTRLQVEHPVTEAVTGVDLVRAQFLVAGGSPLPWAQTDLSQRGHAVECRIYAEDPANGFLPQAGNLLLYREPSAPGIRIDSGFVEGDVIAVNYDPLIAKLIAHAETREVAIDRAVAALRRFPILGIRTNVAFLIQLLRDPAFREGAVHTSYIDERLSHLTDDAQPPPAAVAVAAALSSVNSEPGHQEGDRPQRVEDPWSTLRDWGR
jgi:acetyl-CoA/propionyl-CoA carboxylase biotin carboxyl carrier protein